MASWPAMAWCGAQSIPQQPWGTAGPCPDRPQGCFEEIRDLGVVDVLQLGFESLAQPLWTVGEVFFSAV